MYPNLLTVFYNKGIPMFCVFNLKNIHSLVVYTTDFLRGIYFKQVI